MLNGDKTLHKGEKMGNNKDPMDPLASSSPENSKSHVKDICKDT